MRGSPGLAAECPRAKKPKYQRMASMTDDGRTAVWRSADLRSGVHFDSSAREPRETYERKCRGMPGRRPALRAREFAGGRDERWADGSGPMGAPSIARLLGKRRVFLPSNARRSGNGKAVSLFDLIRRTLCQGSGTTSVRRVGAKNSAPGPRCESLAAHKLLRLFKGRRCRRRMRGFPGIRHRS